jgi:hypothetical protein
MTDLLERDPAPTTKAVEKRRKREREARLAITAGRTGVLAEMMPPLIIGDNELITSAQLCDYLKISRTTLLAIARRHQAELLSVGYQLPVDGRSPHHYSPRAILHVALLLDRKTSERATIIAKALGVDDSTRRKVNVPAGTPKAMQHMSSCIAIMERAYTLIEFVHERDSQEVWELLEKQDRWQLQSLIIALAALIPDDVPGLQKFLTDLGAAQRTRDTKAEYDAARGLALLIPVPHRAVPQ